MADENVDSEIVSQFLLNTCRLSLWLTESAVSAAAVCVVLATNFLDDDDADGSYQLSFTTTSRYLRLSTVIYQAMCT